MAMGDKPRDPASLAPRSLPDAVIELRVRAGHTQHDMAQAVGLAGPSGWRYYEDGASRAKSYLPMEWRGPVMAAFVGKGAPPITQDEVDRLFSPADGLDETQGLAAADSHCDAEPAGNRIAQVRKRRGLTQIQLADALGIGRSQVVKLERGERRLTVDWARKIADALGVGITDIIAQGDPVAPRNGSGLPAAGSAHVVIVTRAAIQAAERIVAQAGPINTAPRDVVRQILVDVLGFQMEAAFDE